MSEELMTLHSVELQPVLQSSSEGRGDRRVWGGRVGLVAFRVR